MGTLGRGIPQEFRRALRPVTPSAHQGQDFVPAQCFFRGYEAGRKYPGLNEPSGDNEMSIAVDQKFSVHWGMAVLICLSGATRASNPPIPPADHPRVLIRPSDILPMRSRYHSAEMTRVKEELVKQANATSDGRLPDGKPRNIWNDTKRKAFEAKAFLYLIEGNKQAGTEALEMVLTYFRSVDCSYKQDGLFVSRAMNRAILGAAMVYDWCYHLMGPDQKQELIEQIYRVAEDTEYGWPVKDPGFVSGHYGEEKHPYMLAAGIAVYDEDPSIYNTMARQLYSGFVPVRNFFYPGHKHHQGNAYGIDRFTHEVEASFLMTRMGFANPCVADQGKVPYFFIYNRTPDDLCMVEGDDYSRGSGPGWFSPPQMLYMIASMYQDPVVQDETRRYASRMNDAAFRMLIQDEKLKPEPVSKLPLTKYFGSPFGAMIARTGWEVRGGRQADAAVVRMHTKEYMFANHDHLDAGHFSFYYKGSLAIDSGVYQGTIGKYGSEHFRNYYQRSIAHNTLLILDPAEPKPMWWGRRLEARDGGQFWPDGQRSEFRSLEHLLSKGPRAKVLAHEFGPDAIMPEYSYLKGDITQAYNAPGPYPAKVGKVVRSFVFLNLKNRRHPAALIVFDRVVSTKSDFTKTWLLHSIHEPSIDGGAATITRADEGYNGKLVNHTMLPEAQNRRIVKIGGPGREFFVDGQNYPNLPVGRSHEPGGWRIEISPAAPEKTDHFLNVMHVMDAVGGPKPLTPIKLERGELIGVQIADRAVFFSKSGERLSGEISLTLSDSHQTIKCLVTDLERGQWQVRGPADYLCRASDEGGAVYFDGAAGTYRLKCIDSD